MNYANIFCVIGGNYLKRGDKVYKVFKVDKVIKVIKVIDYFDCVNDLNEAGIPLFFLRVYLNCEILIL